MIRNYKVYLISIIIFIFAYSILGFNLGGQGIYIDELSKHLKEGGFIYGVVHNEKSIMAKVLKNRWPAYRLQHPHLFNPSTINLFFKRSKFKKVQIGDYINLELPLKFGKQISGHTTQGHVDCTGKISSIKRIDKSFCINSFLLVFEFYHMQY